MRRNVIGQLFHFIAGLLFLDQLLLANIFIWNNLVFVAANTTALLSWGIKQPEHEISMIWDLFKSEIKTSGSISEKINTSFYFDGIMT